MALIAHKTSLEELLNCQAVVWSGENHGELVITHGLNRQKYLSEERIKSYCRDLEPLLYACPAPVVVSMSEDIQFAFLITSRLSRHLCKGVVTSWYYAIKIGNDFVGYTDQSDLNFMVGRSIIVVGFEEVPPMALWAGKSVQPLRNQEAEIEGLAIPCRFGETLRAVEDRNPYYMFDLSPNTGLRLK